MTCLDKSALELVVKVLRGFKDGGEAFVVNLCGTQEKLVSNVFVAFVAVEFESVEGEEVV